MPELLLKTVIQLVGEPPSRNSEGADVLASECPIQSISPKIAGTATAAVGLRSTISQTGVSSPQM